MPNPTHSSDSGTFTVGQLEMSNAALSNPAGAFAGSGAHWTFQTPSNDMNHGESSRDFALRAASTLSCEKIGTCESQRLTANMCGFSHGWFFAMTDSR